jgi:hypothetical protein
LMEFSDGRQIRRPDLSFMGYTFSLDSHVT